MRAEVITIQLNDTTVVEDDIDRQTKNDNQSVLRVGSDGLVRLDIFLLGKWRCRDERNGEKSR